MAPVFIGPGEPCDFGAQDDPDLAQHDRSQACLEANALGTGGGTVAQVIINPLDLRPPEGACPFDQGVLARVDVLACARPVWEWIAARTPGLVSPGGRGAL
jgi:hypothetical protein